MRLTCASRLALSRHPGGGESRHLNHPGKLRLLKWVWKSFLVLSGMASTRCYSGSAEFRAKGDSKYSFRLLVLRAGWLCDRCRPGPHQLLRTYKPVSGFLACLPWEECLVCGAGQLGQDSTTWTGQYPSDRTALPGWHSIARAGHRTARLGWNSPTWTAQQGLGRTALLGWGWCDQVHRSHWVPVDFEKETPWQPPEQPSSRIAYNEGWEKRKGLLGVISFQRTGQDLEITL